jgi:hypothetical protein
MATNRLKVPALDTAKIQGFPNSLMTSREEQEQYRIQGV